MHAEMIVLDPIGDLIVIIQRPNSQAVTTGIVLDHPSRKKKKKKTKIKTSSAERRRERRLEIFGNQQSNDSPVDSQQVHEDEFGTQSIKDNTTELSDEPSLDELPLEIENNKQNFAQFRISSNHLRLASTQYGRFLGSAYQGKAEEQMTVEDGTTCNVLRTEEWDPRVFLLLLNIVHGYNRQVPDSVDMDTLGKLAILTDYYECHERVELFARRWIDVLKGNLPETYGKPTILWLVVSWVFADKVIFKKMTEMVVKHSKCPFKADDLPLPPMLIANLERERQRATDRLLDTVLSLKADLEDGKRGCSDACCSMLLGSIIREMKSHNIGHVWSTTPFDGSSLEAAKQMLTDLKSPRWHSERASYSSHSCTLTGLLQSDIDKIWTTLEGFDLEDYVYKYNVRNQREPSLSFRGKEIQPSRGDQVGNSLLQ